MLLPLIQQVKIVPRAWEKQLGKGTESRVSRTERDYLILEPCGAAPQQRFKTAKVYTKAARPLWSLPVYMFFIIFRESHRTFSLEDVPEARAPLQASRGLAVWPGAERPFDTGAGGSSMMPECAAI